MNQEQAIKMIAASLSGNIPPDDRDRLSRWVQLHPANQRILDEARVIWERSGMNADVPGEWETEEEWLRLEQGAGRFTSIDRSIFSGRPMYKIAAAVLFLVSSYLLVNYLIRKTNARDFVVVSAGDQPSSVALPDGSYLAIESHSEVRYKKDFSARSRHVELSGNAFFDVKRDSLRPFQVVNGNGVISVLGTSFSVSRDSVLLVAVTSGKVSFASVHAPGEAILLTTGEAASLAPGNDARPARIAESETGVEPATKGDDEQERTAISDDAVIDESKKEANDVNEKPHETEAEREGHAEHDTMELSDEIVGELPSDIPLAPWRVTSQWKKNDLNQTVVEGRILNRTKHTYKNIVLEITCSRPNGKSSTSRVTVYETIAPGAEIDYKASLMDLFGQTRDVKVSVVETEEVPQ